MREIITTTGASLFTAAVIIVQAVATPMPAAHDALSQTSHPATAQR